MRGIIGILILCLTSTAFAHMPDRHDLDPWFSAMRNNRGNLCCSFTDGAVVASDDWDNQGSTENGNSGYRVRLEGNWFDVPEFAVIHDPNRYGAALAWPTYEWQSGDQKGPIVGVHCFMPGAGT